MAKDVSDRTKTPVERSGPFTTVSGVPVERLYTLEHLQDLNYDEDSNAETDMNVVMLGNGQFVEVQGTAEGKPFSKAQANALLAMAQAGIKELFTLQKKSLKGLNI